MALTHKKYALDLLWRDGMLKCNAASTPMAFSDKLSSLDEILLSAEDATQYGLWVAVSPHHSA